MYIRVSEIPRAGLDIVAARGTAWIPKVLQGMSAYPLEAMRLEGATLFLTLVGRTLIAEGSLSAAGEGQCDRCTEPVSVRIDREFRTVLIPAETGTAQTRGKGLHEEDLDIGYYDGAGVEVNDIFWEQVALALPVKVLCREECRGVCPRCGADRNRVACDCPGESPPGPFDVLVKPTAGKE